MEAHPLVFIIVIIIVNHIQRFWISILHQVGHHLAVTIDIGTECWSSSIFVPQSNICSSSHQDFDNIKMALCGCIVNCCPAITEIKDIVSKVYRTGIFIILRTYPCD